MTDDELRSQLAAVEHEINAAALAHRTTDLLFEQKRRLCAALEAPRWKLPARSRTRTNGGR